MATIHENYDAIIIGGGFYGASIALYLSENKGFKRILLVEQEDELLNRASKNNQARAHNGYHYPRSLLTAYSSRQNFPQFVKDWKSCIDSSFTKIYAIGSNGSKVNSSYFSRFANTIEADIIEADPTIKRLFNTRLVDKVFEVKEYAFNVNSLRYLINSALKSHSIEIQLSTEVNAINKTHKGLYECCLNDFMVTSNFIFNCSYSRLNQFFKLKRILKHEITEICLTTIASPLVGIGVTIMDGPFFSYMPFPSESMYSLSHVRYTPHFSWTEKNNEIQNPYEILNDYAKPTNFEYMKRDAQRFLPCLQEIELQKSFFEVKTVLVENEIDDGRPILIDIPFNDHTFFSILGGKLDNIYDILKELNNYIPNKS